MLQGFKDFIARGNAVDLAVGVVIGAAFGKVIDALVEAVLNPLVGAIFGQPNLDYIWTINIGQSAILPGFVLTALINFILVAAAIYFLVVVPLNKLAERRKVAEEPEEVDEQTVLLSDIRDLLARQAR